MGARSLLGPAAHRPSRSLHRAAGGLLAAALALAAASPAAATQPRPGEPGGKFSSGELNAVAAVSSTDAWIVGDNPNANDSFQTLVLHWDGKRWFQLPAPSPGGACPGCIGSFLVDVSAVSSSDAWAVGSFAPVNPQKGFSATLALHWNGVRWTHVPTPSPGEGLGASSGLGSVTALSASDAWAVGSFTPANSGHSQTLILHWNGSHWTRVPSPNPAGGKFDANGLSDVSALSPSSVWAVGEYDHDVGSKIIHHDLIVHWNGQSWAQVPAVHGGLTALTFVSASDGWAVGCPQVLHWDGTSWTRVPSPASPGSLGGCLGGVTATSAADAWAAGSFRLGNGSTRTWMLHWDGAQWSRVHVPDPGSTQTDRGLSDVAATSATNAWAVGSSFAGILLLHWNGSQWAQQPVGALATAPVRPHRPG
jgi:hypothetical protein